MFSDHRVRGHRRLRDWGKTCRATEAPSKCGMSENFCQKKRVPGEGSQKTWGASSPGFVLSGPPVFHPSPPSQLTLPRGWSWGSQSSQHGRTPLLATAVW
jgi:hypothetical protein